MIQINKRAVVGGVIIGGLLFFGVSLYINTQQSEYVALIKLLIVQQEKTLISLAEVTDRNGADAVVASIIRDCAGEDRQKFNELLGTLGSLNQQELIEVDQLFSACGNFDAERKALMTARLSREFEVYADYVAIIGIVNSRAESVIYPVDKWSELVSFESQRSTLSSQLVVIQQDIITALLEGVSIQSERMLLEISKAQEAKDTLSYTGVKIDALREDIIGL